MSVTINGSEYISTKEAGSKFGYTPDYVTKICRTGNVQCERIGKSWFVDESSLENYLAKVANLEAERFKRLRREGKEDYRSHSKALRAVHTVARDVAHNVQRLSSDHKLYISHAGKVLGATAGVMILVIAFVFGGTIVPKVISYVTEENSQAEESAGYGMVGNALTASLQLVSPGTTAGAFYNLLWKNVASWFGAESSSSVTVVPTQQTPDKSSLFGVSTPTTSPIPPRIVTSGGAVSQPVTNTYKQYVAVTGVSEERLQAALSGLENSLKSIIYAHTSYSGYAPTTVVNYKTFADSQKIDQLDSVRISNSVWNGGSVSADDISAETANFTTLTVDSFTVDSLSVSGALTAPYFIATSTTATSTFAGGLAIGTSTPFGNGLFTVGTSSPLFFVSGSDGSVGIGTTSPLSAFVIDATDALRIPVGTTAERPAQTQVGQIRYNSSLGQFEGFANGTWGVLGSGGGSSGGTWSTTTSQVSGQLINYPNNTTDIVAIGSTATTTAAYWFDPNISRSYFSGNVGIGTTSPYARLSVAGDVVAGRFVATTSATSTFSGIEAVSLGATATSTLNGLTVLTGGIKIPTIANCSQALETDANGAIVCGTDATGGGSNPFTQGTYYGQAVSATSTALQLSVSTVPYSLIASSTALIERLQISTTTASSTFAAGIETTSLGATATSTLNGLQILTGGLKINSWSGILKATAGNIAASLVDLATDVTGTLTVGNGGTGQTSFSAGNLLYGSGSNALSNVATTSITAGTGIFFSSPAGALVGGNNFTISGIGTTSELSANQLTYATGKNTLASVATTTLSFSGPFNGSASIGSLVGGSNTTITWSGLSTSTEATVGNLLYFTGKGTTGNVATTSVTCTGNASCTGFTVLGSSPISISVTGGGGTGGTWSTTTSSVAGQFINYPNLGTDVVVIGDNASTSAEYWFDPNITTAYLSGRVGIGTTSPGTTLSLQSIGNFAAGNSTLYSSLTLPSLTATTTSTSTFLGGLDILRASTTATSTLNGVWIKDGSLVVRNLSGFLKATAGVVGTALVDLATDITGTLPIANGGTNASALSSSLLWFNGTSIQATSSQITIGSLIATTTATSTFREGWLALNALSVSTTTATSSFANGIQLTAGCFRMSDGTCAGTGGASLSGGIAGALTYWTSGSTIAPTSSLPLWIGSLYATTSNATSTIAGGLTIGTTTAAVGNSLLYVSRTTVDTQPSLVVSGSGNVGIGTSSPYARLSVAGDVVAAQFVATGTATSTFLNSGIQARAIQTGFIEATSTTASSTFSHGVSATSFGASATSTLNGLQILTGGLKINSWSGILKATAGNIAASLVDLATDITGVLPIANGGTNASALSSSLLWFNGTSIQATSSALTVGSIISTTTATSTFNGGIQTTSIGASATSTFAGITALTGGVKISTIANCTEALETDANGAIVCGTDSGITGTGINNSLAVWTGTGTMGATSTLPLWIGSLYATTSNATSTIAGGLTVGTTTLDNLNHLLWLGRSATATQPTLFVGTNNNVGIGTSSPYARLSVAGDVVAAQFVATGTATSTFLNSGIQARAIQTGFIEATSTTASSTFSHGVSATSFGASATSTLNGLQILTGGLKLTGKTGALSASASGDVIAGTLSVANGGTNATQLSASLLWFNGTSIEATSSQITIGSLIATTTATSTFNGGIQTLRIYTGTIEATSTNGVNYFGSSVGIGTTTPWGNLSVQGTSGQITPLFQVASSSNGTSFLTVTGQNGYVGIGTSSPTATLSLNGSSYFSNGTTTFDSSAGANFNNNFVYDGYSGITTISNLYTGAINFDTDAGTISAMNLPLSAALDGTDESYSFNIAAAPVANLYVYGQSNGSGGVKNQRVGIATATPVAIFSIEGTSTATGPILTVASSSNQRTFFTIDAQTGRTSVGTSTIRNGTYTQSSLFSIWDEQSSGSSSFLIANSASTTLFSVPNAVTSTSTLATGLQVLQIQTGYINATNTTASSTFSHGVSATSFGATATSTLNGLTVLTGGIKIPTIANCSQALETDANGAIVCGTDATGGGSNSFTQGTYYGQAVSATSTALQLSVSTVPYSLIASSTALIERLQISTTTASSTFAAGIETTSLGATATSTLNGLQILTGGLKINSWSGILKATAGNIAASLVDLATDITGTLPIANGGTNASALSSSLLWFNGTSIQATSSQITIGSLIATTTATSTFREGWLALNALSVSTTTATSSFANGIQLTAGCFRMSDGTCAGTGGASLSGGIAGALTYWTSGSTIAPTSSLPLWIGSLYATTSNATSTIAGGLTIGTTTAAVGNSLLYVSRTTVDTQPSLVVSGSGNVGIGTSSPYARLSVAGDVVAAQFVATGTATSTFLNSGIQARAIQTGFIEATSTTASSTFSHGVSATSFGASATSTLNGLQILTGGLKLTGKTGALSASASGDVIAGTLSVANGGTNATQLSTSLLWFNGTSIEATSSQITIGSLIATTTATSTFNGGIQALRLYTGTVEATSTNGVNYFGSSVGIGTTTPTGTLGITGTVFTSATTTSAVYNSFALSTSTLAGGIDIGSGALQYDLGGNITSVERLQTGALSFETNAGAVSWFDLPVASTAPSGTVESYTAQINANPVLTVYGEATGAASGGARNLRVGIATSTPVAIFSIEGTSTATGPILTVASSSNQRTFFTIDAQTGRTSVGTSTIRNGTYTQSSLFSIWDEQSSGSSSFLIANSASTTLFSVPNAVTSTSTLATGLQVLQIQTGYINATNTTASSTFSHGISATSFGATATSTLNGLQILTGGLKLTGKTGALSASASGDVIAGTLSVANGGTNATQLSASLLWFNGTSIEATSSQITIGSLIATTTATSTFSGGIQALRLYTGTVEATSTNGFNYFMSNVGIGTTSPGSLLSVGSNGTGWNFFDNATTTSYAKGIDLKNGGCFAVNGTCLGDTVVKLTAINTYAATTSYTKPTNMSYIVVEIWGAGGGGGNDGANGGGGGGGGGGYAMKQFNVSALSATTTPLIGVGTAGAADGGNGGPSSFAGIATSTGGTGGTDGSGDTGGNGGAGGTGQAGDINLVGEAGMSGDSEDLSQGNGGTGGSAPRGGGGGVEGAAGSTFGGGGGGAATTAGAGGVGGVVIYEYTTVTSGADIAENYPVADPSITSGDIVAFDTGFPLTVKRAEAHDKRPLVGVISTQPGIVLGDQTALGQRPVALAGRVPVKVNLEGGPIQIGDRITLSSIPGVGKKADVFDDSVGIAIDSYDGSLGDRVIVLLNLERGISINDIASQLLGVADFPDTASTSGSTVSTQSLDFVGGVMSAITNRIAALPTSTATTTASTTGETASSTPSNIDAYADGFLQQIFSRIQQWFANAANGIGDFFANRVRTKELCVGDESGEETCVTKAQLDFLLSGTVANAATGADDSGDTGNEQATTTDPLPPTSSGDGAPLITLNGNNPAIVKVGETYADLGATVSDDKDQNIGYHTWVNGLYVDPPIIDTSTTTTYTIEYVAVDTDGNTATSTRTIIVENPSNLQPPTSSPQSDTAAPVIVLNGTANVELSQGDAWTDPGATALDETDGDITSFITVSGAVDTALPGAYILTYAVKDAAGNLAETTRTVTVAAALSLPVDETATTTP